MQLNIILELQLFGDVEVEEVGFLEESSKCFFFDPCPALLVHPSIQND